MIEWLTIALALGITTALIGVFGFVAWKINMSDPLLAGKKEDFNTVLDSDKKKKEKSTGDQTKKKRKDSKKIKRDNKDDDHQRHVVKFKEPSTQTSEETDNEREESEQELQTPVAVEKSSKARRRRNKQATSSNSSEHLEGILANKDEKSPVTNRPEHIPHPKLAHIKPKDEIELAKQHQNSKSQGKLTPKNATPTLSTSAPVPVRKPVPLLNNANQKQQLKQEQALQDQQDQPFTTVGSRHKPVQSSLSSSSSSQQQSKQMNSNSSTTPATQQQNKQVNSNPTLAPVVQQQQQQQQQQQHAVQISQEQLPQRQSQPARQQKEPPTQVNGMNLNSSSGKQTATVAPPQPPAPVRTQPVKLADLVKSLPTSQVVVTELMSALDAFPLSTDELDIIMHKIANKQSVLNKDWTKLQQGQKVDPQAHIGQVLDESARAYQEDMKSNAMKHIKDLNDELANDKRRINELINETQALRAQLNAVQHPQQQLQSYHIEIQRLNDENNQLKQRLYQQQHLPPMNLVNNNTKSETSDVQFQVLSEQLKKLSVDNGNLEKQLKSKDLAFKEFQKEKDDLNRVNQQLKQENQEKQKQFQRIEDKHLQELNEVRTVNLNQLNDFQRHIDQLQNENQQLKQANQAANNQEREDNQQYKLKYEQLQQELQQIDNLNTQLADKNTQIETLKKELEELKSTNDSKQKQFLSELIREDQRNQLPNDQQDLSQWLSAYKQLFESSQQTLQEEAATLKRENDQLHKNMSEIESQLKEIEQTVQSKEELLLTELKNKDVNLESLRHENDKLSTDLQLLRTEIDQLQTAQNSATNEIQSLKVQLDEQHLVNSTNPSTTTADDLYEFIKQPSPPPSENDTRAEELNELIRSSKEALENQDSIVQQLDKHLNEMHRGGTGEVRSDCPPMEALPSPFYFL